MFRFINFLCLCSVYFGSVSVSCAEMNCQMLGNFNLTIGKNLEWIYYRNGEPHYFMGNGASNNRTFRERFHFNFESNEDHSVQLADAPSNTYLMMNPNGHLVLTNDYSKRSFFQLTPLLSAPEFSPRFHIRYNGQPLVTRSTKSPLTFATQSNYPNEPVAEFGFNPFSFSVKDSYRGNRSLILRTAQMIPELGETEAERDVYYTELLKTIKDFGHLPGKEIFEIGQHIFEDLGSKSKSFQALPSVVQTVCSGELLSFYFPKDSLNIPMKNHSASINHKSILPYNFTSQLDSKSKHILWWAITYGENRQLYYSSGLKITVSNTKRYIFQLHLHDNLDSFQIAVNINGNPPIIFHWEIGFQEPREDYFFGIAGNYPRANWTVVPFDVDVERIYSGNRENIIPTANLIQNSTYATRKCRQTRQG